MTDKIKNIGETIIDEGGDRQDVDNHRYEWYLDRFGEKQSRIERLSENQDKIIFAFSTGALILSINLIDGYVAESFNLLKWSWIFLIASAVSVLISMQVAIYNIESAKKALNNWLDGSSPTTDPPKNLSYYTTLIIDVFSKVSLIIGIILMTIFACSNIKLMDKQQNTQTSSNTEKSAPNLSNPLPPPGPTLNPPSSESSTTQTQDK